MNKNKSKFKYHEIVEHKNGKIIVNVQNILSDSCWVWDAGSRSKHLDFLLIFIIKNCVDWSRIFCALQSNQSLIGGRWILKSRWRWRHIDSLSFFALLYISFQILCPKVSTFMRSELWTRKVLGMVFTSEAVVHADRCTVFTYILPNGNGIVTIDWGPPAGKSWVLMVHQRYKI